MPNKCQLAAFIKTLTLLDKDTHRLVPFEPNWAQMEFLYSIESQARAGKPVRIIVLKARQLGISTVTEAVLFWWAFMFPGSHELIISHEAPSTLNLFDMTRRYWETFPWRKSYTVRSY